MTNWRIYLLGGLLAAMFALSMYIAHLQTKMAEAEAAAKAAAAQSDVTLETAAALDRVITNEHNITERLVNVVREIEALPSGEALVPDDVSSAWASGIDGVRNSATGLDSEDTGDPKKLPKD